MPKLKVLSGELVIKILKKFDFAVNRIRGSHVVLARFSRNNDAWQTLIVPNHKTLKKKTLRGIYREALNYISEEKLREHFYLE
jgi:predicted RNA binding protein YcfA (HicA-like mRNA interferase family)